MYYILNKHYSLFYLGSSQIEGQEKKMSQQGSLRYTGKFVILHDFYSDSGQKLIQITKFHDRNGKS